MALPPPTPLTAAQQASNAAIAAGGFKASDVLGTTTPSSAPQATPQPSSGSIGTTQMTGTANPITSPSATPTPAVSNTPINPLNYSGNSIVDALSQSGQPSSFADRSKLASQAGIQNYTGSADQNTQLLAKYKQGFNAVNAGGTAAPDSAGQAKALISKNVSPIEDRSMVMPTIEADPTYQQLLADRQEYTNVLNQRKSLTDTYKQLTTEAGIPALNTELMNMKNVIEGSEDDLRNEITKAGGFATESQVMALTSSRNKQLIKNYNNLLEAKNQAMENVNTMVGLAEKDQSFALQSISQKMQIDQQIASYADKFKTNAQQSYQSYIKTINDMGGNGYASLYQATNGDPYYVNLVEKNLGLPAGGLASAATITSKGESHIIGNETTGYYNIRTDKQGNVISKEALGIGGGGGGVEGIDPKVLTKIQSSPEYKTINGVLPSISALTAYKDAIKQYGTAENFNGQGKGTLQGTYGNALATWKTLAGLGALSGADFGLAENAVPETGFFKRSSTSIAKIDSSINNAVTQAENLTKRLIQNYPTSAKLLTAQLDDMKLTAYPEKFVRAPDGSVIEITK